MISRYRRRLSALEKELAVAFAAAAARLGVRAPVLPDVALGLPREPAHGDFATAAALAAAQRWKRNPADIAYAVTELLSAPPGDVASVDVARPGFINLRLTKTFWADVVREALERGDEYGKSDLLSEAGPISIEFASPNPTGPLLVVQGRSCALGAGLTAMLRFAGCPVCAETYVNDAGAQLDALGDSLYYRYAGLYGVPATLPEDGYHGEYLLDIARLLQARDGDKWLNAEPQARRKALGRFARDSILSEQRADMERFRVHFDRWVSEADLHESGKIDAVIRQLQESGHAYEHEGAVWLRSTEFGDDKDRVLRRSDGRPTYLAADAAYHRDKLERGNRLLLNVLGPDHHGYVARLKAVIAALGAPGRLEVLIAQQVTLKRGAEVVSMSKRAGNVVTLRDVVDEVGVDAARFFFSDIAPASRLVFDLDLAVQQSAKNPVYYVQYGHARIASILRRAQAAGGPAIERALTAKDVERLGQAPEIALIRRLADFERTVAQAARARAPHRVAEYARQVATDFHAFYTDCVVLGEDVALTSARLSLCLATKTVLASALQLLGVSAPERM
jgi:arginyl-tRNA synthetase